MVPMVLMLWAAQGPPQWSEPGKRETRNFRPSGRNDRYYSLRARRFGFDTDDELLRTLDGLAREQSADGSWGADIGITGVTLLAYLDAGYTTWAQKDCRAMGCRSGASVPGSRAPPYHPVIRRAVGFLRRAQGPDGFIGMRGSPMSLRDHAIAARALTEAWGGSGLLVLAEPAEKAIEALAADPGLDDATVAWTATAFRSAAECGLPHARSRRNLLKLGPPPAPIPPLRTAVDTLLGPRDRAPRIQGIEDPHVMYWGTEALYFWDSGSAIWRSWAESVVSRVRSQPDSGSLMATALKALTLTVVYQQRVYFGR